MKLQRLDECKAGDKVQRFMGRHHGTYTVVRVQGIEVEVVTKSGQRGSLYSWLLVEVVG